jgi:alcohol dehydrogenase (cytochrome c)
MLTATAPAPRTAGIAALVAAALLQLAPPSVNAQGNAPFTPAALTAPPKTGWPTNGGNLYNQRYSPLTAIDRSNVAQLKGVWRTRLHGSGSGPQYSGEAQPIVHDGIVYVITGADDVFAISVDTGAIVWDYKASLDPAISVVCCSSTASSWRSINARASSCGRFRPSAGRKASRSRVRRCTTTAC